MASTVQATKNKVIAERGSIATPIDNQVLPVGSHFTDEVKGAFPKSFAWTACQNTSILPIHARNADPIASEWLSPLLRLANKIIIKKASRGGSGISQIKLSMVICL